MPFLHDLRRRVPPQDIQSRIVVCIHVVALSDKLDGQAANP